MHNASATDVADRLSEIFEPGGGKARQLDQEGRGAASPRHAPAQPGGTPSETVGARSGESLTKILADERTNSLIIVATERSYLRILEMLKYLDVSMEGGGKIHVHHLQHSDAEELANTLQSLISGRGAGGGGGKARRARARAPAAAAAAAADVFEGAVAITANKGTNALVITSSAHDYAALRPVIDLLDSARKQVFIEAVIMELSVDRNNSVRRRLPRRHPRRAEQGLGLGARLPRAATPSAAWPGMAANGDMLSGPRGRRAGPGDRQLAAAGRPVAARLRRRDQRARERRATPTSSRRRT